MAQTRYVGVIIPTFADYGRRVVRGVLRHATEKVSWELEHCGEVTP